MTCARSSVGEGQGYRQCPIDAPHGFGGQRAQVIAELVLAERLAIIGLNFGLAQGYITAYHGGVRILPISKMKDKLNEYVDAVAQTQDQITITKNGAPAAVLVGADEWESLQETLYWLSQPGIKESIAEADADIAAGRTYGEDEIRAEFGVPRRAD